jgi:hypothetical protein
MQQLDLFSTEEPAPPTLDDVFARLSRHGWDRVGAPRTKGGATFHEFRRGTTDEFNTLAEGELSYWLADLDRAAAHWACTARKELAKLRRAHTGATRSEVDRAARAAARHITDVELSHEVYREIVVAMTPALHHGWEEGQPR